MADLVITGSPTGDRVIATCPGDTPVFDSPEIWVTLSFLINAVHPFVVDWSTNVDPDGCPNAIGTLVKIPGTDRVWRLTGVCRNDALDSTWFQLRWPD